MITYWNLKTKGWKQAQLSQTLNFQTCYTYDVYNTDEIAYITYKKTTTRNRPPNYLHPHRPWKIQKPITIQQAWTAAIDTEMIDRKRLREWDGTNLLMLLWFEVFKKFKHVAAHEVACAAPVTARVKVFIVDLQRLLLSLLLEQKMESMPCTVFPPNFASLRTHSSERTVAWPFPPFSETYSDQKH